MSPEATLELAIKRAKLTPHIRHIPIAEIKIERKIPIKVVLSPEQKIRRLAQQYQARMTTQTLSTVPVILRAVALYYDVDVHELKSHRRNKETSLPRQVAIYLAKQLTLYSYPKIGFHIGGRDHSTILHSVRKIETRCAKDPAFRIEIGNIKSLITGMDASV